MGDAGRQPPQPLDSGFFQKIPLLREDFFEKKYGFF
jgi:hypothetical protein